MSDRAEQSAQGLPIDRCGVEQRVQQRDEQAVALDRGGDAVAAVVDAVSQRLARRREALGMALVVAGVVLLIYAQ